MSRLAHATSPEAAHADLLLVPVGALEQHGPHLPLDTDTVVAVAVAEALAERLPGSWVAPAIGYGASGEHQHFAGTSSIGNVVLRSTVIELVRSMRTWARRVVLVNGHGGNVRALESAVAQLSYEGHDVTWVPCAVRGGDLHAGRTETSLMLHLRPASVRLELAVRGETRPLREILPALMEGGVAAVSGTGVLGDPAGADAGEGAALLEEMVEAALDRLGAASSVESAR